MKTINLPLTCKELWIGLGFIPPVIIITGVLTNQEWLGITGVALLLIETILVGTWLFLYIIEHYKFKCRCDTK